MPVSPHKPTRSRRRSTSSQYLYGPIKRYVLLPISATFSGQNRRGRIGASRLSARHETVEFHVINYRHKPLMNAANISHQSAVKNRSVVISCRLSILFSRYGHRCASMLLISGDGLICGKQFRRLHACSQSIALRLGKVILFIVNCSVLAWPLLSGHHARICQAISHLRKSTAIA